MEGLRLYFQRRDPTVARPEQYSNFHQKTKAHQLNQLQQKSKRKKEKGGGEEILN